MPAEGTPAPAAAVEAPKEAPGAAAFAALARRERQAKAAAAKADAARAALVQEEARVKAIAAAQADKLAQFDRLSNLMRDGKETEVLEALGMTYEGLIKKQLAAGSKDPGEIVRQEIAKFKADFQVERQKEVAQQEQVAARARLEADRTAAVNHIAKLVEADEFELVRSQGAAEMVLDVMEAHYKLTGKAPSFEEAARATESHLEEHLMKTLGNSKRFNVSRKDVVKAPPGATPAAAVASEEATLPAPPAKDPAGVLARIQAERVAAARTRARKVTIDPRAPSGESPASAPPPKSRQNFVSDTIRQFLANPIK